MSPDRDRQVRISKFLSLVLRYDPARIGLTLDAEGWADVDVDLGLAPLAPPKVLFHGTSRSVLPVILAEGLRPMGRRHVHLSADRVAALSVGRRHGLPAVLVVDSARMHGDGHQFFRSVNGVWLTNHVPPAYLSADTPPQVSPPG